MKRVVVATVLALLVAAAPVVGQVAATAGADPVGAAPSPGSAAASPVQPTDAATLPTDDGNESESSDDPSPLPERWSKTAGGDADDKLSTGIKVDGGYFVVGWSNSSTSDGLHDGYVAALDRAGETKWERTYGGPGNDRIFDIERVDDGYLVAGLTSESDGEPWKGWVMKLGPDGEKRWERTYGDRDPGAFWSLARSEDSIYVAGWQEDGSTTEAWAMKLGSDGKEVWSETYGTVRSSADEYFNSVFATDGGKVLLTGTVLGSSSDPADAWVVKAGNGGDVVWNRFYGGAEFDRISDAAAAADGGYVLAGRTASEGAGEEDGWMLKIRDDGATQWTHTYGTEKSDGFFGIHADPDGGYVLSGAKHLLGDAGADGWVVRTDDAGKQEWQRTYGESYWDKFWRVVEGHGGGYLAVGDSTSYGESRDGWVVRLGGPAVAAVEDAAGNETRTVTLDGSPVRAVTLSDSNVSGVLSVAERANLSALSPPGEPIYAVTTGGTESVANGSATVQFTVRTGAVDAELSDVRVAERTADGWSILRTTVVSESNGTAVVAADTSVGATLAVTSVPAPTASIDVAESVLVGESVDLSAASSMAENGELASYDWSVGGTAFAGETASASFDSPGVRTVNLTVTDENGISDTATATLVVNDRPEVSVRTPDAATVGEAKSFSADVSDEVGDVTVTWKFGDGQVSGESIEHSFGSPGTKTVTVVVEDEYGATVTKEVEVEVKSQGDATQQETATTGGTDGGVPGFGVGAALLALVAAALLAVGRRE